jgi:hypothetical protein
VMMWAGLLMDSVIEVRVIESDAPHCFAGGW